jgi:hypothetical protein
MGYGHLRAAIPLAEKLGVPMLHADRAPLADEEEQRTWARTRRVYEGISRLSQVPLVGTPLRLLLDTVTAIPHLYPYRDMSGATYGVHLLDRLILDHGLGRGLLAHLRRTDAPLITTFFAVAVAADRLGWDRVYCVVTDTDINRIWVPMDPRESRIVFLTPARRVSRRLRVYGVPEERIRFTGFPLPDELLGGPGLPTLRRQLAARLVRLDPEGAYRSYAGSDITHFLGALPEEERRRPPTIVYAVGGAGAQADLPRRFLPRFRRSILAGRIRIVLVAGVRQEVEESFRGYVHEARLEEAIGRGVEIVREPTLEAYFGRMKRVFAEADVLWTKPSEMVFYGALGLPLVLSDPVGVHERYNRRWAVERGAGLRQRDPRFACDRFAEWLADGTLAAAAWSGFMHLPKFGLYRVLEAAGAGPHVSLSPPPADG